MAECGRAGDELGQGVKEGQFILVPFFINRRGPAFVETMAGKLWVTQGFKAIQYISSAIPCVPCGSKLVCAHIGIFA